MIRDFTCIMCPRGCEITGELEEGKEPVVTGNACPKGADYVRQELIDPMRNIASSVRITGAEEPVVSVRLNHPVPKSRIFDVMEEIRNALDEGRFASYKAEKLYAMSQNEIHHKIYT